MFKKFLLTSVIGFSSVMAISPYGAPTGYGMPGAPMAGNMYGGYYGGYKPKSSFGSKISGFFSNPSCHSKYTYGKMMASRSPHQLYMQQVMQRCPMNSVQNFYRAVCHKAITPIPGRYQTNPHTGQQDTSKPAMQLYLSMRDRNAHICQQLSPGHRLMPSQHPKLRGSYELVSMYGNHPSQLGAGGGFQGYNPQQQPGMMPGGGFQGYNPQQQPGMMPGGGFQGYNPQQQSGMMPGGGSQGYNPQQQPGMPGSTSGPKKDLSRRAFAYDMKNRNIMGYGAAKSSGADDAYKVWKAQHSQ